MPKWACKQCTFENAFAKTKCVSCGASKEGKLPVTRVKEQAKILSQAKKASCEPISQSGTTIQGKSTPSSQEMSQKGGSQRGDAESTPKRHRTEKGSLAISDCKTNDKDILASASAPVSEESVPLEQIKNDTVISSLFSTASGTPVAINKKALEASTRKHLNHDDDENTSSMIVSSLFSTAAGKSVKISKKGLQAAESRFASEPSVCSSTEDTAVKSVELSLFSTASGRPVRVSAKSLQKGKEIVDAEPTLFETGSGRPIKLTPEALQVGDEILSRLSQDQDLPASAKKRSRSETPLHSTSKHHITQKEQELSKPNLNSRPIPSITLKSNLMVGSLSLGGRKPFVPPTSVKRMPSTNSINQAPLTSPSSNTSCFTLKELSFNPSTNASEGSLPLGQNITFAECSEFEFPSHINTCPVTSKLLFGDTNRLSADQSESSNPLILSGSEGLFVGPLQYQNALLALGADVKGCSKEWIRNALTQSCWFASHMPMFHTPPISGGWHYSPKDALSFLVHHYNSEYVRGERPVLRKICEKDLPSTTRMELFVVHTDDHHTVSNKSAHPPATPSSSRATISPPRRTHSPAKSLHSIASVNEEKSNPLSIAAGSTINYMPTMNCCVGGKVLLSDGHYTVAATIDPPLAQMAHDRLLLVGALVEVWGAVSQTETAGTPLEIGLNTIVVSIGFNGTKVHDPFDPRRMPSIDNLGQLPITPQDFPTVSIRKIHPFGGVVPSIVGVVTRVLPPHFQEREGGGGRRSQKFGDTGNRGPRSVRNLLAEERKNEFVMAIMQKETERLLNVDTSSNSKTREDFDEVSTTVRDKYARDVNIVCTVIIEEDTGNVAVVQQWMDGTAATFAAMENNLPKEGTRIRMYNLHPSKGSRPNAPFHGKLLFARPTFNFLVCPVADQDAPEQLFAFERRTYSSLDQFEGSMANTMVDICCIIIDVVRHPATATGSDFTTIVFCTSTKNVFGSLEIQSTPYLEISLPSPPSGTTTLIQNIVYKGFDRSSGAHNVVRFSANEYTCVLQRPSNVKFAKDVTALENIKNSIQPTLEIGRALLSETEKDASASYLVKVTCGHSLEGKSLSPIAAPSAVLLPTNPVDAADCLGSELRQGHHSLATVRASGLIETPTRTLFNNTMPKTGPSYNQISVYSSENDDPSKAIDATETFMPTPLANSRSTVSPSASLMWQSVSPLDPNPAPLPKRTMIFSKAPIEAADVDKSSEIIQSAIEGRIFSAPPRLNGTAVLPQLSDNTGASPVEVSQPVISPMFPVDKQQWRHQFGNFIPSSFVLKVNCGPVSIEHRIVDPDSKTYEASFRTPTSPKVLPFYCMEPKVAQEQGLTISLVAQFNNGFAEVSTVVNGIEAVASLLCEMIGPVGTMSSACAVAGEHWYHLSVTRAALFSRMETEEERWEALLLHSSVVSDDNLGLCLKEEELTTGLATVIATVIDYPALGTMKRWNQALYSESDCVLWWHADEWQAIRLAIQKCFHDRLVKITVSEPTSPNELAFSLNACFPVKENCNIVTLI